MGIADRHYNRDPDLGRAGGRGSGGSGGAWPGLPVPRHITGWLIFLNLAVVGVQIMGFSRTASGADWLVGLGSLSPRAVIWPYIEFWRFLTFQFLHANAIHLGLNMLGLWFFGRAVEEHLGGKKFLALYLTCGVCGGLLFFVLYALGAKWMQMGWPVIPGIIASPTPELHARMYLIGASGGVLGLVMSFAYLRPNEVLSLIFPPIDVRARKLAYFFAGLAMFNLLFAPWIPGWVSRVTFLPLGTNQGGDAAHVGGALAGYFLIRNTHLLRDFFDIWGKPRRRKPAGPRRDVLYKFPGSVPDDPEAERVLDKVRAQGMESLTEEEREILKRDTLRRQRASQGGPS